jgi:hypothetical protein
MRALIAVLSLLAACAAPERVPSVHALERVPTEVRAWPQASQRFHSNGAWLGADSAYSIALDEHSVLWLFADTFLDPTRDGTRENGPNFFIRNSVALQRGERDLARDTLDFFWGPTQNSAPSSFFHDLDGSERWVWPLHGARLPGGELLVFRMQVAKTEGGLGFAVDSWDAIAIDDPLLPPDQWQPRSVIGATKTFGKLLGSSVLIQGAYVYAYAVENQPQDHAIFLARWPVRELAGLAAGALDDPEWFTDAGFVRQSALPPTAAPAALFQAGQVELSVHFDAAQSSFVEVQMQGLFVSDPQTQLALRTAPKPEGPWSALSPVYRPSESQLPNAADLAAYAGKAHPEQRSDGLVLTYVVNDLKHFPPGDQVYYPQVLRLKQPHE